MFSAFGSLEGVDLGVRFLGGFFHVGGHIAFREAPFRCRIGEDGAVFPGGEFFDPLAALTLLDDGMTAASIELAALLLHKGALDAFLYGCAKHVNHILSLKNTNFESAFMPKGKHVVKKNAQPFRKIKPCDPLFWVAESKF
ncbi:hypothetical protein TRIP_B200214 [uncultured Desulfatiglans sp.]|uniref:Uncharacterized protein n=1 Tax=Uncultured Desulfatiglans sp. TaxID=1748965 RepID=A0A653A240_UNCDX|nr:hypothetical protein TRIP_B200214 [uncultured Desulfatiglans sp.]